jgi:hypothetical protein
MLLRPLKRRQPFQFFRAKCNKPFANAICFVPFIVGRDGGDETERDDMKRLTHLSTCFLACLCAGAGLLVIDECRRSPLRGIKPTPQLEGWDCRDVVNHLRSTGLDYQVVSTSADGPRDQSVYLTKSAKPWSELNTTLKVRECIDAWRGAVYCEKVASAMQRREQVKEWGDCCLQIGSFVFFGDRDMLAEIASSLAQPAPSRG